ncbi:MAG: hypothetical protein AAGA48_13195 [Myxococcota bacterium]
MTLHQATRGFHRLVVLFVERWAAVREPTYAAKRALAEAYVHLRLLGRAFSRVEALIEVPDASPDVWVLGVTILRMRGWLDQATAFARRAERAFPENRALGALVDVASEPWPAFAPASDSDLVAVAIADAEQAMVQGQLVRAQVGLQRIRRQLTRPNGRVDELLWAIRGDFEMDAGIDQLVPLLLPNRDAADTLVPIDDHSVGSEPSTEAFRQLFRNLDLDDEVDDPDLEEPTHITEMAELAQRARQGAADSDTHVMRVVHREPAARSDPDVLETQLAASLSSPTDGKASDYARPDHLEDDAIVVVTRREEARTPIDTEPFAVEVARVTRDARREAQAHEKLADAPEAFLEPPAPPPPVPWTAQVSDRLRAEGQTLAFWVGGIVMLAVVGVFALGLVVWFNID